MPINIPPDPSDGTIAPASWGDAARETLIFLTNPPACRVTHSTTQAMTDNTEMTVLFDTERHDTDAMHSTSSNTGRITMTTAGLYVVGFQLEVTAAADYVLLYAWLRLNGATGIAEIVSFPTTASAGVHLNMVTTYKFAAGDYVEIRALQDNSAAASRNLLRSPNKCPEFYATWIGLG